MDSAITSNPIAVARSGSPEANPAAALAAVHVETQTFKGASLRSGRPRSGKLPRGSVLAFVADAAPRFAAGAAGGISEFADRDRFSATG
jgi:hypothetical protein